ncbi:MAG: hypothetical protein H8E98_08290 [Bacteroidetes bacterium]|nr:hypothetical protein [Bacteroidota bacterium]
MIGEFLLQCVEDSTRNTYESNYSDVYEKFKDDTIDEISEIIRVIEKEVGFKKQSCDCGDLRCVDDE